MKLKGRAGPVQDPGSNSTTTDKARQTEGGIITERLLESRSQAEVEHCKFKANMLFVTSKSNSKTLFQNKIQQKGLVECLPNKQRIWCLGERRRHRQWQVWL